MSQNVNTHKNQNARSKRALNPTQYNTFKNNTIQCTKRDFNACVWNLSIWDEIVVIKMAYFMFVCCYRLRTEIIYVRDDDTMIVKTRFYIRTERALHAH